MKWYYKSENLEGNVHVAVEWINTHHPTWDVVAMEFNGGGYTVVVHRELLEEVEKPKRWTEILCQKCGGNGVIKISGGSSECPRCEGRCYDPA